MVRRSGMRPATTSNLTGAVVNPTGTLVIDGYTGTSGTDAFKGTTGANTFRGSAATTPMSSTTPATR